LKPIKDDLMQNDLWMADSRHAGPHSLLAVQFDLATAIFWQQHLVSLFDADRDKIAILVPPAWSNCKNDSFIHLSCVRL